MSDLATVQTPQAGKWWVYHRGRPMHPQLGRVEIQRDGQVLFWAHDDQPFDSLTLCQLAEKMEEMKR